jgi:hypothetical protein
MRFYSPKINHALTEEMLTAFPAEFFHQVTALFDAAVDERARQLLNERTEKIIAKRRGSTKATNPLMTQRVAVLARMIKR